MTLGRIDLQDKARPRRGRIEFYWFENSHIGLPRTRFHRIVIPFEPFDSSLEWVHQPEETELVVEWIELATEDPADLDGVLLADGKPEGLEASIYVGHAHNWLILSELRVTKRGDSYVVQCSASVDFESEGVGLNETLEFTTEADYVGEA